MLILINRTLLAKEQLSWCLMCDTLYTFNLFRHSPMIYEQQKHWTIDKPVFKYNDNL